MKKEEHVKVLLVEDHREIAATICDYLEHYELIVEYAHNCNLAKEIIKNQHFHVIVLDINLPDGNGYDLCLQLRNELNVSTPIIMLTARDSLEDRLTGFDAGADDYLVKPFELPELLARINALNNRALGKTGNNVLQIGDLVLDLQKSEVSREGKQLKVSPIGIKILAHLMRSSPKTISRKELELNIWGDELPESDSLRSHLYILRKTIDKPFEHTLIETVASKGVRIKAP